MVLRIQVLELEHTFIETWIAWGSIQMLLMAMLSSFHTITIFPELLMTEDDWLWHGKPRSLDRPLWSDILVSRRARMNGWCMLIMVLQCLLKSTPLAPLAFQMVQFTIMCLGVVGGSLITDFPFPEELEDPTVSLVFLFLERWKTFAV